MCYNYEIILFIVLSVIQRAYGYEKFDYSFTETLQNIGTNNINQNTENKQTESISSNKYKTKLHNKIYDNFKTTPPLSNVFNITSLSSKSFAYPNNKYITSIFKIFNNHTTLNKNETQNSNDNVRIKTSNIHLKNVSSVETTNLTTNINKQDETNVIEQDIDENKYVKEAMKYRNYLSKLMNDSEENYAFKSNKTEFDTFKNDESINSTKSNSTAVKKQIYAKNSLVDAIVKSFVKTMFNNITMNVTEGKLNRVQYNLTKLKERLSLLSMLIRLGNIKDPEKINSTLVRRMYQNMNLTKGKIMNAVWGADPYEPLKKFVPKGGKGVLQHLYFDPYWRFSTFDKMFENESWALPDKPVEKWKRYFVGTPSVGTNTATTWDCQAHCIKVYFDYGAVCAARLNIRFERWQYRYKTFTSYCEMIIANCIYPYYRWWVLHQGECDFKHMPVEDLKTNPGDIGEMNATWTARPTLPMLWPDLVASRAASLITVPDDGTRWPVDELKQWKTWEYIDGKPYKHLKYKPRRK